MSRRSPSTRPALAATCGALLACWSAAAQPPTEPPEGAQEAPAGFLEAFEAGSFHLGLRYRFEQVDDDAFADDAEASTLRTTLSYRTGDWRGWSLFLEAEDVSPLFDDDDYNNAGRGGRGNGVGGVPVVADPEGTAMGQAYVRWQGGGEGGATGTTVTLGRQEINLGDQRFVGAVGWRQHHQSFDAARVEWNRGRFAADYTWASGVNRIFGDRMPLDGHLLQLAFRPLPEHTLTGYGFHLDYDDPSPLSTLTAGLEAVGSWPLGGGLALRYEVEAAVQEDAGDNPLRVDTDYRYAALGLDAGRLAFDAAWEVLGGAGDGERSFATPLATLHKWNGWADRFLQTPAVGLETLSVRAAGPLGPLSWTVVYLDFSADEANLDLGSEVDAQLSFKASWGQTFALKLADYAAGDTSTDTRKFFFWSTYTF